jgi:rSAM/selenodomain-associated transferase 2
MKLSIIIPTYQEADNIAKLVAYLRKHGAEHVQEIMVVDGGSKDETVAEALKSGASVIPLNAATPSRALQMNLGAEQAQGDVLYFVHADTLPPSTFASDILHELNAGYHMGCYRYQFDSPRSILKFNAWFVRFQWLWCQGGDKTFFIRKNIFWELNGYNPDFVVMEEYDFLRHAKKKYPLRIIPKNVVVSARKYEKNSWLRVQIANAVAFSMFRLSMDSRRIRDTYRSLLR